MRLPLLPLVLGLVTACCAQAGAFRIIELPRPSDAELDEMRASGAYEFLEVGPETVTAVEDTDLLARLADGPRMRVQLMRRAYKIQHQDADDLFAAFRAQGSEGAYHSYDEVVTEITAMANHHPDRVQLVEFGRSIEDRPLYAVRVGKRDGVERPAAVFMGMIHAREWISTEFAMAFLHKVVAPSDDLAPVLAGLDVYVVPVLNPDGLIHSQTQYTWWRGNRRPHDNGRFGVDLNRNFPTGWGTGSSTVPGSQTYRGASPLSEPESAAFDQLVQDVGAVATMTWHAYGRMVLLPFGYKRGYPARKDKVLEVGTAMGAATGFSADAISKLIGVVGGATDDHFLVQHGAWVSTLELGTQFIPPENRIQATIDEAMPAAMIWLKAIPGLAGLDPRVPPTPAEAGFRALHRGR